MVGFKPVAVFSYQHTVGAPLPVADHTPRELPPLADFADRLGVEVTWQPSRRGYLGARDRHGQRIEIGTHDPAVSFHELAHAARARLNGPLKGGQHVDQETATELTSCVLMYLYGLGDRTGNAWRYIQHCAADPIQAIARALDTVEKVLELLGVLAAKGRVAVAARPDIALNRG